MPQTVDVTSGNSKARRKGETWAEWKARIAAAESAERATPASKPEDLGYTKAELEAERSKFKTANGAGGLGGARKANDPAFKKRMRAHLAAWAAKKKGKKKAMKTLGRTLSKFPGR